MVNCKLNKLILVSNATYYYMQEVFSFKKRTPHNYTMMVYFYLTCVITATNIAIKPY